MVVACFRFSAAVYVAWAATLRGLHGGARYGVATALKRIPLSAYREGHVSTTTTATITGTSSERPTNQASKREQAGSHY